MARKQGKTEMAKHAKVHTSVNIGEPNGLPGFGLSVDIKVEGVDDELLKAGHEVCSVFCFLFGFGPFSDFETSMNCD